MYKLGIRILILFSIVFVFLAVAADAALELRNTFIRLVMSATQSNIPFSIEDNINRIIFQVNRTGGVGINTSSPNAVLDVNGTINGTAVYQGKNRTAIPITCSGTDKVSAINPDGTVTCSADQTGAGGGSVGLLRLANLTLNSNSTNMTVNFAAKKHLVVDAFVNTTNGTALIGIIFNNDTTRSNYITTAIVNATIVVINNAPNVSFENLRTQNLRQIRCDINNAAGQRMKTGRCDAIVSPMLGTIGGISPAPTTTSFSFLYLNNTSTVNNTQIVSIRIASHNDSQAAVSAITLGIGSWLTVYGENA